MKTPEPHFDANLRKLLEACHDRVEASCRDFEEKVHGRPPASVRAGRLGLAAAALLCTATFWVLLRPSADVVPARQDPGKPEFRFRAVDLMRTDSLTELSYLADFTPAGPVGASKVRLQDGRWPLLGVCFDVQGARAYGFSLHGVFEVDPGTGKVQDITPKLEEFSWPRGAAFDALRKRLLVVGGGGARRLLWSFDPATREWEEVASLDGLWPKGLAYADDVLYAMGGGPEADEAFNSIYKLSPRGALIAQTRLSEPIPHAGSQCRPQLVAVGPDRLIVLPGPVQDLKRTFVVEPSTGRVVSSCVQSPR